MTLPVNKLIADLFYYIYMLILKGVSYLKSNKISRFLFSQLAKYGILIRSHLANISNKEELSRKSVKSLNKYSFILADNLALQDYQPVNIIKTIPHRFLLVYDTKNILIDLVERFSFIPILAYPLRVSFIAKQILNHFNALNSSSVNYRQFAFRDSLTDSLRVFINNSSYFTLTSLPDLAYLEYRGATIRLSQREKDIMEQLIYGFKEAINPCVRFPNIKSKDLANSISRLRSKFSAINLPVLIKNNYGKGYCLETKLKQI